MEKIPKGADVGRNPTNRKREKTKRQGGEKSRKSGKKTRGGETGALAMDESGKATKTKVISKLKGSIFGPLKEKLKRKRQGWLNGLFVWARAAEPDQKRGQTDRAKNFRNKAAKASTSRGGADEGNEKLTATKRQGKDPKLRKKKPGTESTT